MARPDAVVEFAPGFTPFDTSPTWVDISSRVISLDYSDGRQKGLDAYPPGEATVVLGNEDRLFDPEYEAGTYSGQLLPRVPFRIRARSAGPTYRVLFYGFVEGGWEQDWRPPGDMVCTVTLVDWLGVIASYRVDDYLDDFVLVHDPIAWWRFDETRNTTEVVDRSGNDHHALSVSAIQGEAGLTPGVGRSVFIPRAVDPITVAVIDVPVTPSVILSPPFTVCWVSRLRPVVSTSAATHYMLLQLNAADLSGFTITFASYNNIDGAGTGTTEHGMLAAYQRDGSARREIVRSESAFDDDTARFYAVVVPTWDASDWEIRFSSSGSGTSESSTVLVSNNGASPPPSTPDQMNIGNYANAAPGADYGLNGNMDHLMFFPSALTSTQINTLNDAIWDYTGGQTTGAGIDWVLDRIGVPAAFRDIDTGDEMMGVTTEYGALERMRGIEQVERGALYVDHAAGGVIKFRSASALAADTRITTSQNTLSDEDTTGVFHYERKGLTIEANGIDSIINRQTVEWAGGTVTVQDDGSVDAYGPRSGPSVAAPAENYASAKSIAQGIVAANKEPKTRVRSLAFDAGADDSNFDLLLDLLPRDRQTLERRPLGIGSPIIQDVYYEGGKYQIGPGLRWDGQLFLSTVPTTYGSASSVSASAGSMVKQVFTYVGLSAKVGTGPFTVAGVTGRAAADKLLLGYFEVSSQPDPATPTGWTQQQTSGSGHRVFSRTATANSSDDAVVSQSVGETGGGMMVAYRGASSAVYGVPAGAVLSPVTAPSATATAAGDELLLVIVDHSSTPSITTPAGFTLLGTTTDTAGGHTVRASVFHRAVAGAGAVGTTNVTYSGSSAMACKVLVSA